MKSYTERLTLYKKFTRDASSENESLGITLLNDSDRIVANMKGGRWPWLAFTDTITSETNTGTYPIPTKVRKIIDGFLTVGTTKYLLNFIYDSNEWNRILRANLGNSDAARYAFVEGHQIVMSPGIATAGSILTLRGRRKLRDLSIGDYSTGSIVTATAGSKTITGTGTSWAASMAGRWIRIGESDTANKGDGYWYEIASVTNTTTLVLLAPYAGTSIVAGTAAYTIGQMSYIPEDYDMAPIYRSTALFWVMKDDEAKANMYWSLFDGGHEAGKTSVPGGLVGQMMESYGETTEGAYIPPNDGGYIDPNIPPRYPISI